MSYVRIDTPAASHIFEVETIEEALAGFARAAGYGSFAELAGTLGETVEKAQADLSIEHVTAADIIRDIADEAAKADVIEGGAEEPFRSVASWVRWCVEGSDGDAVRDLAKLHGLDLRPLLDALEDELGKVELSDINAPFGGPDAQRVAAISDDILAAVQESILGGSELESWTGGNAIDAYAEGSDWAEEIKWPALREAVAARIDADLAEMRADQA